MSKDLARDVISPQEYREENQPQADYRLVYANVRVQLLPEPRRAQYAYELCLETVGTDPATGWAYEIPSGGSTVSGIFAKDELSTLETNPPEQSGPSVLLHVRFRQPVQQGSQYVFYFGYETEIRSVVTATPLVQTVVYSDWFIFRLQCQRLTATILLPPRASRQQAVPEPSEADTGTVQYVWRNLRPLDTSGLMVAYRQPKLGLTTFRWAGSAIGAGLLVEWLGNLLF
jgi:hypothetical protein